MGNLPTLTTGDKFLAGVMAAVGFVWCGPFIWILLTVAIALLLWLPLSLFGAEPPGWLFAIAAVLALGLTVLLLIGVGVSKVQDEKEKRLIREAEVQRARRDLDEPTPRRSDAERLREELRREREERRRERR